MNGEIKIEFNDFNIERIKKFLVKTIKNHIEIEECLKPDDCDEIHFFQDILNNIENIEEQWNEATFKPINKGGNNGK